MIKAIIIDLDQTLLTTDKKISDRTVKVMQQANKDEIKILFATARPRRSTVEYEAVIQPDAITTLNGARTYSDKLDSIDVPIDQNSVRTILQRLVQIPGCVISLEIPAGIICNKMIPEWNTTVVDCFPELPSDCDAVYKIIVTNEFVDLKQYMEKVLTPDVYYTMSSGCFFQIMNRNATKSDGVKTMLDTLGINKEDAVYFGDDHDDIGPIQWCGRGIAMQNAIPEVLAVADEVTESNDADGVAIWVEKYLQEMQDKMEL